MTEVPKFHELMWPTLKAIKLLGGSGSNSEIVDKIIETEKFPESVQNMPHTKGPLSRLEYNMAWARSYLKKAGAIDNSERGVWSITDLGSHLKPEEMKKLVTKVREIGSEERKTRTEEADNNLEDEGYSDWKAELLEILQTKLSPKQFERLTQRILRESGFTEVEVTGQSGDEGIDGFGILRLGLLSFKVIFQCNRYKNSV